MSVYILDDKTYEIFPHISSESAPEGLTPEQMKKIAIMLSEHLGCFALFGMSLQGTPQVMVSATCGMEHLALRKFAEDILSGETNIEFIPLVETQNDFEEEDEE